MTLAVNIGNSRITFGLFDRDKLIYDTALTSDIRRCSNEYAVLIDSVFKSRGNEIDISKTENIIISSVVPALTAVIAAAIQSLTGQKPLCVEAGIKTGLDIKIDYHTQLGADIVSNTSAAFDIYKPPFAVIDLGDATTFTAVNKNNELCGVIISAGLRMSLDALALNTSELPQIYPAEPKSVLGKNTVDSMNSGAVFGHACMIDGIIDKISMELNTGELNIIATGFWADICLPYCKHDMKSEPLLTFKGLYKIFNHNYRNYRAYKRYNQP
jgi:type III pantothenate kinase